MNEGDRMNEEEGINQEVIDFISKNDKEWFEKNPEEEFRFRLWVEGEMPPEGKYVLVRNIKEGLRVRVATNLPEKLEIISKKLSKIKRLYYD